MFRYIRFAVITIFVTMAVVAQAKDNDANGQKYQDVISVKVQARGDNRFDFDATIASPYDTPQRYADAFRVINKDGMTYGVRKLFHDHAGEQPFTRDPYGVDIPAGIQSVTIQAGDQKYGYGGKTVQVTLPGR
ncbi:hypothetical protein [Sulfurirhabdus autotrophica]|uniref:DUF2141 domain-containing protein n=1 Tax=Sulfurirhabdus autotrophica TaxID=1706046 RepID=A0A4R3Y831_9PROT|nr:hypothetical protein [Sulfurirhabdus autotrophica]TCV88047.1 hypothetical protein EDC63_1044 [Sulfurirhabdus autotrophica]